MIGSQEQSQSRSHIKMRVLVGAAVALVIAFGAGGYAFLRSDSGSRFLIREAQAFARSKAGVELTIAEGRIDPLHGAHFRGFKLERPGFTLTVDSVDIDYRISLFPRAVTVERFRVVHPVVKASGPLPELQAAKGNSPAPARAPHGEERELGQLIVSPPASIDVSQFAVEEFEADLALTAPEAKARIRGANLHGSFHWLPSRLVFSTDFEVAELKDAAFSQGAAKLALAAARASGHWDGGLRREGKAWVYELSPSQVNGELGGLSVATGPELGVELASAKLESSARLAIQTAELFTLGPNSIQKLESGGKLALGPLHIRQASRQTGIQAQNASFALTMGEAIEVNLEYGADHVALEPAPAPALGRPIRLSWDSRARVTRDFARLEASSEAKLDGRALATAELKAETGADGASASGSARLLPDLALAAALMPAAAHEAIGVFQGAAEFSGKASGSFASLLALSARLGRAPLQAGFEAKLEQRGTEKHAIQFAPLRFRSALARANEGDPLQLKLEAEAPAVRSEKFRDASIPLRLALTGDGRWVPERNTLELDGDLKIQDEEAAKFQSRTDLPPGEERIHSKSSLTAKTGAYLAAAGWMTPEQAKALGGFTADAELEVTSEAGAVNASGSARLAEARPSGADPAPVVLTEPISASGKFQLDSKTHRSSAELEAVAPSIEVPRVVKIADTRMTASLRSSAPGSLDFDTALTQGALTLSPVVTAHAPPLAGANFKAAGSLRPDGSFALTRVEGDFDHRLLRLSAAAAGRGKDAQARGVFALEIPASFPRIAGQLARGKVEFPWSLSLLRGREIVFEGQAQVDQLSWSYSGIGNLGLLGMSGTVPISEKWLWNGKRLSFTDLITRNPFERVDFERVRPMLDSESEFRVEQLAWDERRYGPFVGFFSVKQNMIVAPQFDLDLGREAGHVYGEMYFDAYPADLQFGVLSRATGLNLAEILPQRFLIKMPGGDKTVSGRSGLVVDFNKSMIEGRVDVTEIGSSQLLLMINVLDPKYEDEKMNKVRTALGIGSPTLVNLALTDGYLDMDVHTISLGVPASWDVHGIPISSKISSATSGLMKETQEDPLE